MFRALLASLPQGAAKWCAYSLILLTPGSFFILPLIWLLRSHLPLSKSAFVAAQQRDPKGARGAALNWSNARVRRS